MIYPRYQFSYCRKLNFYFWIYSFIALHFIVRLVTIKKSIWSFRSLPIFTVISSVFDTFFTRSIYRRLHWLNEQSTLSKTASIETGRIESNLLNARGPAARRFILGLRYGSSFELLALCNTFPRCAIAILLTGKKPRELFDKRTRHSAQRNWQCIVR